MPTKYELQAELRELNRGFPRMPISKMKMHELEAAIDGVKKLKTGSMEALATKTPSTTGRPSARPIPVEDKEDEDVVIKTPKAPAERKTGKKKAEEPFSAATLFPGVMRRGAEAAKKNETLKTLKKVEKEEEHECNCEACPKRLIGKYA